MKIVQLFVSLSRASAAVFSNFNTHNQDSSKNTLGEALLNKPLMDPSAKNALKERLLDEYSRIPGPLVVEEPQMFPNPNFNPKNYEELLEAAICPTSIAPIAIMEAHRNGNIDFNYIIKYKYFHRGLLEHELHGSIEVLMKYFQVGTIENMRKSGLISYAKILDTAVILERFVAANMILDYMIEAMLKEIDSEDFDESDWKLYPETYVTLTASTKRIIKRRNDSDVDREETKFLHKYNRIFGIVPNTNDSGCIITCQKVDFASGT